jgi:Uma2 family endonuclease
MSEPAIATKKWTRAEYERLAEAEILGPEDHVELLGGEMLIKEPQPSPHATAIELAAHALRHVFSGGWHVRTQLPVALDDESEPEPDVSVVPGDPRDYRKAHPTRPVLVVEISLSRLDLDRAHKGSLYARAGIADYWIVNIPERQLEIYREPCADTAAPFGWRYGSAETRRPGDHAATLAAPSAEIPVADLLP